MTIIYILLGILLLGILVAVHEFGHFFFARITGIEVREFALGFGPKLAAWTGKKGTKYSIRAIPMGGYCAFYGEDDTTGESSSDPRSYNRQPVWKRILSVVMGPGMNFILAFVVAVGFYWIGGIQKVNGYETYIDEINAAGPAWTAGIQPGDIITVIDGVDIQDGDPESLGNAVQRYTPETGALHMTVRRQDETIEMDVTPYWSEEDGRWLIGVLSMYRPITHLEPCSLGDAVSYSWNYCVYAGGAIYNALGKLVTTGEGLEETAGPVGVVSVVSDTVRQMGFQGIISLLVMLSINLGIMNLLPIPGLDGSRLLFMLIELIFRKPVPRRLEAYIHLAGYLLLFGLMILLTFRDVIRLFH